MKAPIRGVLVILVVLAAAGAWAVRKNRETAFVTASGMRIVAHDATYGKTHFPKPFQVSLMERVRAALSTRSLTPLRENALRMVGFSNAIVIGNSSILVVRFPGDPSTLDAAVETTRAAIVGSSEVQPALALWVVARGKPIQIVGQTEIHLSDGQILLGIPSVGVANGPSGQISILGLFPIAPWREKELDVRCKIKGETVRLHFPNPAYKPDVPKWQPLPLPQTWERDGLSITLKSLAMVWNSDFSETRLEPAWSVVLNGQPADDWYKVFITSVEDAGGNRTKSCGLNSEPAWKLHGLAYGSHILAYPEGRVKWIGRVDGRTFGTIQPGECNLVPLDEESHAAGILIAGLFGPGDYEIEDGKVVAQTPPGASLPQHFAKAAIDPQTKRLKLSLGKANFIRYFRPGGTQIWADEDGSIVPKGWITHPLDGKATLCTWDLAGADEKSYQYGIAPSERPTFEFMVRPPALPGKPLTPLGNPK